MSGPQCVFLSSYKLITLKFVKTRQNGGHFADNTFKYIFFHGNHLHLDSNFTEICFQRSISQYDIIGPDNDLVPSRQQAIIWTNDGLGLLTYMCVTLTQRFKSSTLLVTMTRYAFACLDLNSSIMQRLSPEVIYIRIGLWYHSYLTEHITSGTCHNGSELGRIRTDSRPCSYEQLCHIHNVISKILVADVIDW